VGEWSNFFLGELGAAAALAGLLFVSISVNQARILQLGRMADRGLEALGMLLLILVVASIALIPGQSLRLLGTETLACGIATLAAVIVLQRIYLREVAQIYRRSSASLALLNRSAVAAVALSGAILLWRGDDVGLYLLPLGILLSFVGAGSNAWVLLIEINR